MSDPVDEALAALRAPVEDDGFTAGVMAQLPAPRPRRSTRVLVLAGAACAGVAVAAVPITPWLAGVVTELARRGPTLATVVACAATFGTVTWSALTLRESD
jgi:hypothetical protein